jgi:tellurite resistance protein
MRVTSITCSSKCEGQFVSCQADLGEQDDTHPERLALVALTLKQATMTSCLLNAVADGTLSKEVALQRIAALKKQIGALKESLSSNISRP